MVGRWLLLATCACILGCAAAAEGEDGRRPVPSEADQAERLRELRSIYKEEYARRRPEERAAFAIKLLEQGRATTDDAVARFVFLREAADAAARAGDVTTGLAAADTLAGDFAVSGADERLRFLAAVAPAVTTMEAARAVVDGTLAVADAAVEADDYPLALRAATQAERFAARLRDEVLPARARQALADVKALADEWEAVGDYRDLLGGIGPDGHARYGRFLCFAKGRWDQGAEHLLQGDDEPLKELVVAERAAQTPDALAASGEAWADWAAKQKGRARQEGLVHAVELLRRAQSGLTGLAQARIDKRIAEVEKLVGVRAPRYPAGAVLILTFEPGTTDRAVVRDLGPSRLTAQVQGATPVRGAWGTAMRFDGQSTLSLPNHPSLQTAGSMSLAMWLRPTELGARRNPWNKAYGGEGTWTLEPEGRINFYFGAAGADADPYNEVGVDGLAAGRWTHLVAVRDAETRRVAWYRDGKQVDIASYWVDRIAPSEQGITIGGGYAGGYVGLLDEIVLWPRAMTPAEAAGVHQATAAGRQ